MIKKYRGEIIFFYIASIISLIVASFYDLKIDIALNNPENPIALWFYKTGEVPSSIVFLLGGIVIFKNSSKTILKLIGLFFTIFGGVFFGIYLGGYLFVEDSSKLLCEILYGLGLTAITFFISQYITIPEKLKKPLLVFAYIGITAMLLKTGVIEVSKIFWGRERMRMLLEEGSFENFTQWYQPQGITSSNEYKSFPSGHTGGAAMSYLLMFLPFAGGKLKGKEKICFFIPFVYTSIVAFTRLVMGAHFLSDVTIGGVVGFTAVLIGMIVIDKKANKYIKQ